MILQSIAMSFKAILSNKMRSFLTMLGIIIGVIAVVVLISIGQGATGTITSSIEGMGTNLLSVNIRGFRDSATTVTLAELHELEEEESISNIAPIMNQSQTVKAGLNTFDATIEATVPGYDEIRKITIANGRFLTQPDLDNRVPVAIVGVEVADELFGHRNILGEEMVLSGRKFTIVGLLEEKGTTSMTSNDAKIMIPFTLAERMFSQKGVTTFYASADTSENVTLAQNTIKDFLLRKYNNDEDAFMIQSQNDMLDTLSQATATMTLMLGGIAGISLLVGGIGIMNIMLVSVTERTREIGIRKAIGAGRAAILMQFLIESLVISGLGGVIGLLASLGLMALLSGVLSMSMSLTPSVVQLAMGFSIAIGVVFGLYPANRASKLRPIDALRYDG